MRLLSERRKPTFPRDLESEMDWNAVAAWAEVAGAVAVVISLVYLTAQIKQGNTVAKAAGQESVMNAFRNFTQQSKSLYISIMCLRIIIF